MEPNAYFWIILLALVGFYKLDLFSTLLNMKALSSKLPKEFSDIFDAEKYEESQEYAKENARVGVIESSVSLALLLTFWFIGGFGWLDGQVRGLNLNPVWTGVVYVLVLMAVNYLVGLPFGIYHTFVIEERFGFNKTTPVTFFVDQIKSLFLSLLLGVPVLALVLFLFENVPHAWLYGWLAMTGLSLALAYVAPTWIMPLFNKFTPLEEGELKSEIMKMAENCRFPLKEVMVMDGSKRSTKSNAFFTGFGKNKRIALFDTLIEKHTTPELVAVLAHEIGHFKKRHIIQRMVVGVLETGVMFFLVGLFMHNQALFAAFGVAQTSTYLSLIFFALLFEPVNRLLSVAGAVWSRKHEFEADAFAAGVTHDPASMVAALKKLSKDNLSNLTPHPLHVFLNYSHPPVLERIRALKSDAAA